MTDRRCHARELLIAALGEVERELAAPTCQLRPDQLGACRATLQGYLVALDGDALPPKRERGETLGRLVHDSWPYDLPLGTAILKAERAFRNV